MVCEQCPYTTDNRKSFSNHRRFGCPNTAFAIHQRQERTRAADRIRDKVRRKEPGYRTTRDNYIREYQKIKLIDRIGEEEYGKMLARRAAIRNRKCFRCGSTEILKGRKYCGKCKYLWAVGNTFYKSVRNYQRGSAHHSWKGGLSGLRKQIRDSGASKHWRTAIFQRDHFQCRRCFRENGYGQTVRFEAHHSLFTFAAIIQAFSITNMDEALRCPVLWDISNGITLCSPCHDNTKMGNPKDIERIKSTEA